MDLSGRTSCRSFDIGKGRTISGAEVLHILENSATSERLDKVLKVGVVRQTAVSVSAELFL